MHGWSHESLQDFTLEFFMDELQVLFKVKGSFEKKVSHFWILDPHYCYKQVVGFEKFELAYPETEHVN